jgi:chaperonin GroES
MADGLFAEMNETALPAPGAKESVLDLLLRWADMDNLAGELEDGEIGSIVNRVLQDYRIDEQSRSDWLEKYEKWLNLAQQIAQEKTYPWPKASNVVYPLITSAAIQFHARAYPAIIRSKDVVKGTVDGRDDGVPLKDPQTGQPVAGADGKPVWVEPPGTKQSVADRIGEHMSWQLLEEMPEWEPDTDRLLLILSIVGAMFRKSYFSPRLQRNLSDLVDARNLVVNYHAPRFEDARKTEILMLYPHEVETNIRLAIFRDENYGHDQESHEDTSAAITFLEQHRRIDLDGDGYAEPYIVTVAKDSMKLARIRAAYDDETIESDQSGEIIKIDAVEYYTPYCFIPNPESGIYGLGFGNLLYPINEAINTSLNQLFDAGHLANTGGGFYAASLSVYAGSMRFAPGEYKPVNATGGTIKDSIVPIPFPGPSQVLFALVQFLVEAGKEIASVKDVMVGDLPGDNTSGVATLALIEQGLKVFSAIYKRVHRSLKWEFKKLARLNRRYLPQQSGFRSGSEWREISAADYARGLGVIPVSDPQMVTDMQRLGMAQFLMQFKDDPYFDGHLIRQQMLSASMFTDIDKLLKKQPSPNPEIVTGAATLELRKQEQDRRDYEARMRAVHEEADLAMRRGKDKAAEILALAQAINQLAQAKKADSEVNIAWYDAQLRAMQAKVEALNAGDTGGGPETNPALLAGPGGAAPAQPGAVGVVAPPPGQPPVPGVAQ